MGLSDMRCSEGGHGWGNGVEGGGGHSRGHASFLSQAGGSVCLLGCFLQMPTFWFPTFPLNSGGTAAPFVFSASTCQVQPHCFSGVPGKGGQGQTRGRGSEGLGEVTFLMASSGL